MTAGCSFESRSYRVQNIFVKRFVFGALLNVVYRPGVLVDRIGN